MAFDNYFKVHMPAGSAVVSAGQAIQNKSGDVENFSADVQSGQDQAMQGAAGLIAVAMEDAPAPVLQRGNNFVQMIFAGGGAVIGYGNAVATFNGLVRDLNGQISAEEDEERPEKRAELEGQYQGYLDTLNAAARAAKGQLEDPTAPENVQAISKAGGLPPAKTNLFPGVDFSQYEPTQLLPPDVAAMSAEDQAQWVRDNPDVLPQIAALVTPAAQEILANGVSEDVRNDEVDAETVRLLEIYQRQAPFSNTFYENTSPDELARTIKSMSDAIYVDGQTQTQLDLAPVYSDFLNAAGVALATYSKGSREYPPPADLADRWFEAITDETNPVNASALTTLIRNGGERESFDPDFLADLTSQTYEWEREAGGDPVWGPLNDDVTVGSRGVIDPTNLDEQNGLAEGSNRFDGLANLLHAMENTPEAAEQFFDDGGTTTYDSPKDGVDDVQVNDRLHYLMMERQWPTDDGDGLGEALVGATTHSRGTDEAGHDSAELAGQAAFMIGNHVGEEETWYNMDGTDGWQIPSGMRDDVGEMMASYIPDVNRAVNTSGESDPAALGFVHDDPDATGMALSNDNLDAILNSLGEGDDKKGLEYMSAAALTYQDQQIGDAFDNARMPDGSRPETMADLREAIITDEDGHESTFADRFGAESSFGGNTLSTIIDEGYKGGKADEAIDQAARESLSRAFGAATSFVPSPTNAVAGAITSEGLSFLGEQMENQPDSASDAWAEDADQSIEQSLRYSTYDHMLRNGLIAEGGPGGLPDGAVIEGDDGQPRINPELYANAPEGVDPQLEQDFNNWLIQYGESDYSQDLVNDYRSNFPQFGPTPG
ncbi:MAG: hypothetical protein Q7T56_13845 [Nocardioidaceae bacterium]|nr:hypothetical protein [Nocardioidaceae bacterium]